MYKVGAIRSGIGNILGFKQEGFHIEYAIDDREMFYKGISNWENHFNGINVSDDFNDFDDYVDVIISSPPCAQISSLGAKRGDRKYLKEFGLYDFDFIKTLKIALKRDADFLIVEYLPGILNFFEIEREFIKHKITEEKLIFSENYRGQLMLLEGIHYGVSQRRRRLFLILSRRKFDFIYIPPFFNMDSVMSCGEVFKKLDELRRNKTLLNDNMPNHSKKRIEGFSKLEQGKSYYGGQNNRRLDPNKISPAITSHMTRYVHPWENRVLNVRECATLQGFPMDFEFFGTESIQLDIIGKTIIPQIARSFAKQIKECLDVQKS